MACGLYVCQAITLTNYDVLSIGPLGTYLSEIWVTIQQFYVKKINFKKLF